MVIINRMTIPRAACMIILALLNALLIVACAPAAHAAHCGSTIDRSVFVSIMFGPTGRTLPLPFSQLQIFLDISALVTPLRGREESSHFLQFSPNLFGLVFQLIDRPTYPRVVCRFSSQLNPSLQAQIFDTHD